MGVARLWLLGAIGCSVSAVACFDLFHSTKTILTACELDATTDGCGDAGTDFCAWSPAEAEQRAQYACAWLGACQSPMAGNALGPCVFAARLAFDCSANPNHAARGAARALWDCLQRATSCEDVDSCVFPAQKVMCGSPGGFCVTSGANEVHVECGDAGMESPSAGEPCTLWGQSCASGNGVAKCAGSGGAAGLACTSTEPECTGGSQIHWCDSNTGLDIGMDCADNGAGLCNGFPVAKPHWLACIPTGDGGTCEPDASATCAGGVAYSCPAGIPEQIDCAGLLGATGACTPGPLSPPFDWTSPCVLSPPACNTDSCSRDTASAVGCNRGAEVTVNCGQMSLGPCRMIVTGPDVHAACSPPPQGD